MGAAVAMGDVLTSPQVFTVEGAPESAPGSLEAFYADLHSGGHLPADRPLPWEGDVSASGPAAANTRGASEGRLGLALAATAVILGAVTGCGEDDRGTIVDPSRPVRLEKGAAVYEYDGPNDTSAAQCGTLKADARPNPRKEYTDPDGKRWWGFSPWQFAVDGNCPGDELNWIPK